MRCFDDRVRLSLALVLGLALGAPGRQASGQGLRTVTIEDLLTFNSVRPGFGSPQVQISPDGRYVVFQMRKTHLNDNRYTYDLFLLDLEDQASRPRQLTRNEPTRSATQWLTPRWSPDSRTIAYFSPRAGGSQIALIDALTFEETQLTRSGGLRAGFDDRILGTVSDFKWAPDGKRIALATAAEEPPAAAEPTRGLEVDVNWSPRHGATTATRLCAITVETRKMDCFTDASLSVHDFDWSPDGKQLAFAANEGARWDGYMWTDLHLLDLASGHSRVLVKQPGRDTGPIWSPDGRWIAFRSQKGRLDWQQDTQLAVVSASGGEPTYPGDDLKQQAGSSPQGIRWSPDSRDILVEVPYHMTHHLFRVPRAGGATVQVTPDDGRFYSQFSCSRDGARMAFTAEGVTEPADIYVSGPNASGARRLTDVNPQLRPVARSAVEVVKWRSKDDKWDIHGVLVKPPDYRPGRRYPLLVYLVGGPQMVRMSYDLAAQYPIQVLAARGYLVLSPNTRGRDGYGLAFDRAIRDHGDYGPGPFLDMMAGVDDLVAKGIADPDRLGIFGFSYGGYLTAYAITQTDRFKGASIGDAVNINMIHGAFHDAGDPSRVLLRQDLYGHGSPWKEAEYERMRLQSPIHRVSTARTPALLEFGERSNAPDNGRVLFQGLQAFHVPSEFVVYPRTGHGVEEPLLRRDSMERNVEWMDYWVLGQATERMAKKWAMRRTTEAVSH